MKFLNTRDLFDAITEEWVFQCSSAIAKTTFDLKEQVHICKFFNF